MSNGFKIPQTQSGTVSNIGTGASSASKTTTKNENININFKNGVLLSEEDKKYLRSKGIDPDSMTQNEIKEFLDKKNAAETEPKTAVQNNNQTLASSENKPSAKENIKAEEYNVEVDFNSEANKQFFIDYEQTGVYYDDFLKFSDEEKYAYFLENFTKSQLGEKWETLSPEQKLGAQNSVEKALAENIENWNELTVKDKAGLAGAFVLGNSETNDFLLSGERASLTEQIKENAEHIVEHRHYHENFNKLSEEAYEYYMQKSGSERSGSFYSLPSDQLESIRSEYLEAKVKENNGDTSCLTDFEKQKYESYQKAKKYSDGDLTVWGDCSSDHESSTLEKMKKNELFMAHAKGAERGSDEYIEAASVYLKSEMDSVSPEEAPAKFKELLFNCYDTEDKLILFKAAMKLKGVDIKYITGIREGDDAMAALKMQHAAETGDVKTQTEASKEVAEATKEGLISEKVASSAAANANEIFGEENAAKNVEIILTSNKDKVTQSYVDNLDKYKPQQQEQIGSAVFENKDEKYDTSTQVIFAKNIDKTDKTVQKSQVEKANSTGKAEVIEGVSTTIHKLDKDNQVFAAKNTMSATETLSEKDAKRIQMNIADQIEFCDKSNQLDIHKVVLTSKHDEVLEHAASNINKYDESVQADAIREVYKTGNEKAIEATVVQLDKCSEKAVADTAQESAQYINTIENKYSQKSAEYISEGLATINKAASKPDVSEKDLKIAYVKEFVSASPQEQYKMLSKLPQSMQGTALTIICRYCPHMLSGLVKQGYGKQILKTPGMSSEVIYKVVKIMFEGQSGDKVEAAKYVTDHTSLFSKTTNERAVDVMAYAGEAKKYKKYSTKPEFIQQVLTPRMSAIYPNKEDLFYSA